MSRIIQNRQDYPLFIRAYETLALIGKGSSCVVRLVRNPMDGRLFVVKQIALCDLTNSRSVQHVITEIEVLFSTHNYVRLVQSMIKHYQETCGSQFDKNIFQSIYNYMRMNSANFIIKGECVWYENKFFYILQEYAPGGDLMSHLIKKKYFSEEEAKYIFAEIVLALGFTHDCIGFAHLDLKPENIFITAEGHLKLGDFGLARRLPNYSKNSHGVSYPEKFYTPVGTIQYMALELIEKKEPYNRTADFWSLGVILFEILLGWLPFNDEEDEKEQIKTEIKNYKDTINQLKGFDLLSFEVQNLIAQLISEKNSRFSNIYDIFSHPWLESIDFKKLFSQKGPIDVVLSDEIDLKFFEQYSLNELYEWEKEKIQHPVSFDIVHHFMSFNLRINHSQPSSKPLSAYNPDNHNVNRFRNKTLVSKKLHNFSSAKNQMFEKINNKPKLLLGYRDVLFSQLINSRTLGNKTLKNDLFRKVPDVFTFCDKQEQEQNSSVDEETPREALNSNGTVLDFTSPTINKDNINANLENINQDSLSNKYANAEFLNTYDSKYSSQNISNLIKKMQENKNRRNLKF